MSRPVIVLPDVESIVVAYLKANPQVDAVVDGRVYGELPPRVDFPAIAILLVSDDVPIDWWLSGAWIQVDCFGTTREQARTLARITHAELIGMSGKQPDGSVVSSVSTISGVRHIGEPVDNRARYQVSVRINVHP
jgi:uncharacterized protein DUF3168